MSTLATSPDKGQSPSGGSKIKWRLPRTAVGGGDPNLASQFATSYSSTFVVGPAGAARAPPQAREQFDRVAGLNSGLPTRNAHVATAISEIVQPGERTSSGESEAKQDNKWGSGRFETSSSAAYASPVAPSEAAAPPISILPEPTQMAAMVREVPAEAPGRKRGAALNTLGRGGEDGGDDTDEEEEKGEEAEVAEERDIAESGADGLPSLGMVAQPAAAPVYSAPSPPRRRRNEEESIWSEITSSDDPTLRQVATSSLHFQAPAVAGEQVADDDEEAVAAVAARAYMSVRHSPSTAASDKTKAKPGVSAFVVESSGGPGSMGWSEGERPKVTQAQARRMLRADALGLLEAMDDGPDRWTTVYGSTVGPASPVAKAERIAGVQRPTKRHTSAYVRQEKGPSTFDSLGH